MLDNINKNLSGRLVAMTMWYMLKNVAHLSNKLSTVWHHNYNCYHDNYNYYTCTAKQQVSHSYSLQSLTLYQHINGHIKTAEQRTIIQQYGDWYIGCWWVGGGLLHLVQRAGDWVGRGPAQSPPRCTKCISPPINGQCTKLHIIWCGTIIASGL